MAFKIDGTTIAPQPSRWEVSYNAAEVVNTADGSPIVVEVPAGDKRRIRVTWGVDGVARSLLTQLESLRSTTVSVTYDDDEGNETTVTSAYMPRVPLDTPPGSTSAVTPYQNPIVMEFIEL